MMLPVTLDESLTLLLSDRVEGKYSKRPPGVDPGGETMWGITAKVARLHGYTGDMRYLPRATACAIYKTDYWDINSTDQLPGPLRYPLFDASVNSGHERAAEWLQAALGVTIDGAIGPETIAASLVANSIEVAAAMVGHRLQFMTDTPIWGGNGRGWARRIALILSLLGQQGVGS